MRQGHTTYGALGDGMPIGTRFGLSNDHNSVALSGIYYVMDPGHTVEFPGVLHCSACIERAYRTTMAR